MKKSKAPDPLMDSLMLDSIQRLSDDIARSAAIISPKQVRYLISSYYSLQKIRISAGLRAKSLETVGEPASVMRYIENEMLSMERQMSRALSWYTKEKSIAIWMESITGIGAVLAAGLLSYIDWENTTSPSRIYAYAGLDPHTSWVRGEKRPWNVNLKVLCYKIGESFVKMQSRKNDFYGHFFAYRKAIEWNRNLRGELSEQASKSIKAKSFDESGYSFFWYSGRVSAKWSVQLLNSGENFPLKLPSEALDKLDSIPMLPPAHIHARARRWAVKLFIAHAVQISCWLLRGQLADDPYAMSHLKHKDYIYPPSLDVLQEIKPGIEVMLSERYGPMYPENQKPQIPFLQTME